MSANRRMSVSIMIIQSDTKRRNGTGLVCLLYDGEVKVFQSNLLSDVLGVLKPNTS
jgi:hypothetical protein